MICIKKTAQEIFLKHPKNLIFGRLGFWAFLKPINLEFSRNAASVLGVTNKTKKDWGPPPSSWRRLSRRQAGPLENWGDLSLMHIYTHVYTRITSSTYRYNERCLNNKYEMTDAAAYAPGRRYVCTHQVVAPETALGIFSMFGRTGAPQKWGPTW